MLLCTEVSPPSDARGQKLPRGLARGAAALPLMTDAKANGRRGRNGPQKASCAAEKQRAAGAANNYKSSSDHNLLAIGVALESPASSASERRTRGKGVLHKLKVSADAVFDLGEDHERRCYDFR
jgi:hypothetical protein